MPNTDEVIKRKSLYDDAMRIYKDGELSHAKELFNFLVDNYDDGVAKYMLSKIQNNTPWGVHKMTTK